MIGLERHLAGEGDGLVGGDLPDRHVRVEERGVGGRDHDVGVGDEVQAAAGAEPLTAAITGLANPVVPGGEAQLGAAWCGGTARAAPPGRG